jgi:hypothetical protein
MPHMWFFEVIMVGTEARKKGPVGRAGAEEVRGIERLEEEQRAQEEKAGRCASRACHSAGLIRAILTLQLRARAILERR